MGKFRIDSREVEPGDVFVAIRSGIRYVQDALSRGAEYCVVPTNSGIEPSDKIRVVEDTVKFLGEVAREVRDRFPGRVLGITGSAGKTTLKEMLAYALSSLGYKVGKSLGNYNNFIGLPASILSFEGDEDFWILELATNQVGDIAYLTEIARPNVAFITSVYPSHLQGLGTVEGVAREKSEISRHADLVLAPVRFFFDLSPYIPEERVRFLAGKKGINFPIKGAQFEDLLALVGAFLSHINHDLSEVDWSSFEGMEGRFKVVRVGDRVIVDDTYNANPGSMKASLTSFKEMFGDGEDRAIVIGDMLELGQESWRYHNDLIAFVKYLFPAARKVCVGREISLAVEREGLEGALVMEEWQGHLGEIKAYLNSARVLFFKASNGMGFSNLIERLFD